MRRLGQVNAAAHASRAAATLDVVASKVEVICPELPARADEVIE